MAWFITSLAFMGIALALVYPFILVILALLAVGLTVVSVGPVAVVQRVSAVCEVTKARMFRAIFRQMTQPKRR